MKKLLILPFLAGILGAGDIEVSNSFVKITPPNMKQTAIFMDIKNNSDKEISLIDANTSLSSVTELHTHIKDGEMMKMIKVSDIKIPAHGEANLKPGGLHIMVFDLNSSVDENTTANVWLKFDNNETMLIENIPSKKVQKMHMKK